MLISRDSISAFCINLLMQGIATLAVADTVPPSDPCPQIGQIAANIMVNRQGGTVMSDQMALLPKIPDADLRTAVQRIIIAAYEVPAWSSPSMRSKAVSDFRNSAELACYTRAE